MDLWVQPQQPVEEAWHVRLVHIRDLTRVDRRTRLLPRQDKWHFAHLLQRFCGFFPLNKNFASGGRDGKLRCDKQLGPHLTEEYIDIDGTDVCIWSDYADGEQVRTGLAKELPLRHGGWIAYAGWRLHRSSLILQPESSKLQ